MQAKKTQLQKHKLMATGLFVLMACIYILMMYFLKHNPKSWMEYVRAFSEAGMVGALADWFAVTALFKYPLGIKIPHTNLITKNKNKLGTNLGTFVSDNFLTATTIRPYINQLNISVYLINWLNSDKNKTILVTEINNLIKNIITNLNNKSVTNLLKNKDLELSNEIKLEKIAATGLHYLLEKNEQNRLINIILPKAKLYVENNRDLIYLKVVEKQPILGLIGGKSVTNQLISGITTFFNEIEQNPQHEIRQTITKHLYELVIDLNENEEWQLKFNAMKNEFLSNEKISEYTNAIWQQLKTDTLESLNNVQSTLNQYISENVNELINTFKNDVVLQESINNYAKQYIYKLVLKNSNEVGKIIQQTVEKWDGQELSEKLELEVGKDLQYIRINGTLVGGLVGLFIYTLTQFFI